MAKICQRLLEGFGMPPEWALSLTVPIFKGKGDIRKCSCYRTVKFLEHDMKVVERELEKMLHRIVSVYEIQFIFMPQRGTIDPVFLMRRMQEEYHAKRKMLYMCLVDKEKAFDIVPRSVGMGIEEERNNRSLG